MSSNQPLAVARGLGATLIVAALAMSAQGQSSVTLAWNPSSGSNIAGYHLYDGVQSRTYTNVISAGTATTATVSGLVGGVTYFFAVTTVGTDGSESAYSSELSYSVPVPTNTPPAITGLTFAANAGVLSAPFAAATGGTVSQSVQTGLANGGQAVYTFTLAQAGNYLVSAMVIAPNEGENSLYVNIDAQPTDPLMIWDIPVSPTLTRRTVSWRGNGNGTAASSQFSPKVFTLSAGAHQLIIRGREGNTTFGTISIAAAPPRLQLHIAPGRSASLNGAGQGGQTYNVLASPDLKAWKVIGSVTADANGAFTFADPAVASSPRRLYRVQSVAVAAPVLQIRATAGGPVILSGTGQGSQTYNVQASADLKTWSLIGTVTANASGLFTFTDPTAASRPRRLYRLQGQ